jgi:hypothetical protein
VSHLGLFYSKSKSHPLSHSSYLKKLRHSNNQLQSAAEGFVKLKEETTRSDLFPVISEKLHTPPGRVSCGEPPQPQPWPRPHQYQVDRDKSASGILNAYDRPRPQLQGNFRARESSTIRFLFPDRDHIFYGRKMTQTVRETLRMCQSPRSQS